MYVKSLIERLALIDGDRDSVPKSDFLDLDVHKNTSMQHSPR